MYYGLHRKALEKNHGLSGLNVGLEVTTHDRARYYDQCFQGLVGWEVSVKFTFA